MLPWRPRGLPGALCKTSKSIPSYSITSLFCQEHSKIFQNKPPKASLEFCNSKAAATIDQTLNFKAATALGLLCRSDSARVLCCPEAEIRKSDGR